MGRSKNKAIYIDKAQLQSKAYLSLTGKAPQVLGLFWCKRRVMKARYSGSYVISNNGEIVFPYTEALKYGIKKSTFTRTLGELIEKGFIDVAHHGGQLQGDTTKYALSDRWKDYGTEQFEKVEREKGRPGVGFAKKKQRP